MNWPKDAQFDRQNWRKGWLWMLSLFLVGLGAKLGLIHRFGTPLPFWDQWDQARVVYLPYFEGKLSLANLLAAHAEHRIFFTRIYSLALLLLNRQWDGQLQMVCNAIIHCATLSAFGWLMSKWLERRYWILVWLPLVLALALPFGWENSLAGFQSQFYFLVVFSLLTIWLLGLHAPKSAQWWCGAAAAVLALFTVASGFLAAAAVFSLVALRIAKRPKGWKHQVPTLGFCAVVIVSGVLMTPHFRAHQVLQAHSVSEFLIALGNNLAWPWIVVPQFAVFNLLPLAALAWFYLKQKEADHPAEEMTLVIGIWAILQGAAAAYARGAEGKPPGWRYMDSSSFILTANCLSIAVLMSRHLGGRGGILAGVLPPGRHAGKGVGTASGSWIVRSAKPVLLGVFVLWGVACAIGLALLSMRAWQIDIPERLFYYRAQLQNARAFMATDDPHVFDGKPNAQLPFFEGDPYAPKLRYEAEVIVNYLRDPRIREILPACVRQPLDVKVDREATGGFVANGFRLARREPPTEVSWGSCTAQGAAATGRFESKPIRKSRLPYLEIPVAGFLPETNLSLDLIGLATGTRIMVRPSQIAGEKWLNCYVKAPAGEFKIVARDASTTSWFAFKAPREVGRLSFWAIQILRVWEYVLFAGVGLFLLNLAVLLFARDSGWGSLDPQPSTVPDRNQPSRPQAL